MKSLKYILFLALFTIVITPNNVIASQNNLVQLDVKKSSINDSVDVTLYTTQDANNPVVTKKSPNKYVLLLPNMTSTTSGFATTGALKDLVTNIDIKTINDGMGGYTKVTFETTKPITIKTSNKKSSSSLSQAQKDSKEVIAKTGSAKPTEKPQLVEKKNVAPQQKTNTVKSSQTVASNKSVDVNKPQAPSFRKLEMPSVRDIIAKVNIDNTKHETTNSKKITHSQSTEQLKVAVSTSQKTNTQHAQNNTSAYNNDGSQYTEQRPEILPPNKLDKIEETKPANVDKTEEKPKETINQNNQKSHSNFPTVMLSIIALFAFIGFIKKLLPQKTRKSVPQYNPEAIDSMVTIADKIRRNNDIANDNNLNWQEKYNLCRDTQQEGSEEETDKNFVKKVHKQKYSSKPKTEPKTEPFTDLENLTAVLEFEDKKTDNNNQVLKTFSTFDRIKAGLSTSNFEYPIFSTMQLKFRENLSKNKKNKAKTKNKNIFSVIHSGVKDMQKESYAQASLKEYFSTLEGSQKRVSNPIKYSTNAIQGNLAVKSKIEVLSQYKIDANRSIYIIAQKDKSAIVGKVNGKTFVLKKFNRVIEGKLQVRPDGNNVYIVRAGSYKCLVEITKDKMGTLLEI